MRSVASSRWAAVTTRSAKVMQANWPPLARMTGLQVSSIMSRRSSTLNRGILPGWVPIASTSRSASRAAWRTRSRWPLVTGSNDPGKSAVRGMERGSSARPEPPQGPGPRPDAGLADRPGVGPGHPGRVPGNANSVGLQCFAEYGGTGLSIPVGRAKGLATRFAPLLAMLTWRDSGQRVPGDADAQSVDGHPDARPRRFRAGFGPRAIL